YARLMRHWREVLDVPILDVAYEGLVADIEGTSRAMVDFLGLEWDANCLRFYELDRVVNTASYDQVRRKIYTGSVGRWRHYEKHLAPLIEALGRDAGTPG
ncbi:MAG: sulfotransferase, partial [Alphaproteobacteria bacterium]